MKKEYYGTYKMNNGCFFEVFKTENGFVDGNGFEITEEELQEYTKID